MQENELNTLASVFRLQDTKIIFRVDASTQIGTGHIMRCMTLAKALAEEGVIAGFICRELEGSLISYVHDQGFPSLALSSYRRNPVENRTLTQQDLDQKDMLRVSQEIDASDTIRIIEQFDPPIDWLIADSYFLSEIWEKAVRPYTRGIMVIDDLADRKHDCDVLLDQNYYESLEQRYEHLTPENCIRLLGPRHALLRKEFIEARAELKERSGQIKNILVFFGGSDPTNETIKTLKAVKKLARNDLSIIIVIGPANSHRDEIETMSLTVPGATCYYNITNISDLMLKADFAIGAGGTTTWERCFLGLPSAIVAIADNQTELARDLAKTGVIYYLGKGNEVEIEHIVNIINRALKAPQEVRRMSIKALELMSRSAASDETSLISILMNG